MKYLGIDYGSRRIGIAVSDDGGRVAFPKETLENLGLLKLVEVVCGIIDKEAISELVIGHSANLKGQDNPVMREIRQFIESLKRKKEIELHLEPEFMTSIQATRVTGRDKNIDAQAAAIILQSFLDKKNN